MGKSQGKQFNRDRVPTGKDAIISPKGVQRARAGHVWIFRSDLLQFPDAASGDVVRVLDNRGRFLALAHFGVETEISLRLLSNRDEPIGRDFWRERLRAASRYRDHTVGDARSYRLVHAEGDLLPGLIIDRYDDCFSIQTLTRGMDALKSMWVETLVEEFSPRLIIERNDVKARRLEGLPLSTGVLFGESTAAPKLIIEENGLSFEVDLIEGQKTGAFLDQRENRAAAMKYARGRGLDCFSFHGSFALHLARSCDRVLALDVSEPAIERARRNAALNRIENVEFSAANVFDQLRDYQEAGERFDVVVLDPPAFAKNRGAIPAALRGYKEINLRAMQLLRPGGVLISCSCSYHIDEALFLGVLAEAAADAGRAVQLIEKRTQSRDHPILLGVPESYYLKCMILRMVS
jgi:23S rRNA (cytosine1962-C5)-methyltransferase